MSSQERPSRCRDGRGKEARSGSAHGSRRPAHSHSREDSREDREERRKTSKSTEARSQTAKPVPEPEWPEMDPQLHYVNWPKQFNVWEEPNPYEVPDFQANKEKYTIKWK